MTPQQIRAAISAEQALVDLARANPPGVHAIAAALSAGRKEVRSRMVSARGLAELFPGGPVAAEMVLMKLEQARDQMLQAGTPETQVMGSMLRRQLGFLAADGLDFGSAALRGMLDQFAALGILTSTEVAGLKSIGEQAAPVTEYQVRCAIFADDGALLV